MPSESQFTFNKNGAGRQTMFCPTERQYDPRQVENFDILPGKAQDVLRRLPDGSVNSTVTSPPYWGQRNYGEPDAIGLEREFESYKQHLLKIFDEVYRVTTDDGSLWLNMGDRYINKDLVGMPWRIALALKDRGWILRQDIIWNKIRMTQSSKDRFRTLHEYIFHFTKKPRYYFDRKSVLKKHEERPRYRNGKLTSIYGVTGDTYRETLRVTKNLTAAEKKAANAALDSILEDMKSGKIVDFRMIIRGHQRPYQGSDDSISGRAKELKKRGYYFKMQKSEGRMPSNIWDIVPEDTHRSDVHCAVYPTDLLEMPIKATCPPDGIVLDPFMGTGTTIVAALKHGRRGLGIDINKKYVNSAKRRVKRYIDTGSEC